MAKNSVKHRRPFPAISIRQPHVEAIFRRVKKAEFRSIPTNIRETVWIYACKKEDARDSYGKKMPVREDEPLPTGVIVGTVEIVACKKLGRDDYAYVLRNPKRFSRVQRAVNQPQPVFWRPRFR